MSTFSCPVVTVKSVENHPDADRLSIVHLDNLGYVCISGKLADGSHRYSPGDAVVYIPSALVLPEWLLKSMEFWNEETGKGTLAGSNGDRVKPLRLRGIFSEGVLYPVEAYKKDEQYTDGHSIAVDFFVSTPVGLHNVTVGQNAADLLGVIKWEPPIPTGMSGEVASVPDTICDYDFERYESVPGIFTANDLVTAVEKAHGTFCLIQYIPDLNHPEMFGKTGCITVSSKGLVKQGLVFKNNTNNDGNLYVQALRKLLDNGLEDHLTSNGGHRVGIFGEIFGGNVQDLKYGMTAPVFRVFEVKLDHVFILRTQAELLCNVIGLSMLPVLYSGPFDLTEIIKVRDGKTTLGGDNVREGVVVTGVDYSRHPMYGRKICKFISPNYLTRKVKTGEATEYQ